MAGKFFLWAKDEAGGWRIFFLAWTSAFLYIFVSVPFILFLQFVGFEFPQRIVAEGEYSFLIILFATLYLWAYLEECLFRMPMSFITASIGFGYTALFYALLSSIVFGYAHGGWQNIFVQGWGGIIWSALYLKSGGAKGKFIKPVFTASNSHFLANIIILIIS